MMKHYSIKNHLSAVGIATILVTAAAALTGCQSDAQTGALFGSGIGAGIGAIVGHNMHGHAAEGALIGAGAGALGGYAVGNESDKQRDWRHPNYDY